MKINSKIAIIFFLYFASNLLAEVKLNTIVDKKIITIGDKFNLTYQFIYDDSIQIFLPDIATKLMHFEIKDFSEKQVYKNKDGKWVKEYCYLLTTFFVGNFEIPSIEFKFKDKNDKTYSLRSSPILIQVKSLLSGKDKDIKDIKEPLSIAYNYKPFIIAGLLLLIIGIIAYIYFRKLKNKKKVIFTKKEILVPADVEALSSLEKLEQEYLDNDDLCKEFYFELSFIFRRYIERRFEILALESSSEELINEIKQIDFEASIGKEYLIEFIKTSELVKFAKFFKDRNERKNDFLFVKNFIIQTSMKNKPNEVMEMENR